MLDCLSLVEDLTQFEASFWRWAGGIVKELGETLAVDGKTVRGSALEGESPIHFVSAFSTDLGIALGQENRTEE